MVRIFGSPEAVAAASAGSVPPSYFLLALLCLLVFLPTGVFAVVNSLLVSYRFQRGDPAGAARASYMTRVFCVLTPVGLVVAAVVGSLIGVNS